MVVRRTLGRLIRRLERTLLRHLNAGIAAGCSWKTRIGPSGGSRKPRGAIPASLELSRPDASHRLRGGKPALLSFRGGVARGRGAATRGPAVPNPHIGFFEHSHMADLMRVLNPRLRK